ncbi:MAG TPA: protein kinase [Gemmatimonadales bacterium]|nr:protein kinase [Gemmatimonadales bacterium]
MELRTQLQAHLGDAFRIERELGGGGMSRVFVATEVRLNRRVAIKVLSPELAQGLNAERFEREILLSASLQQANIVPVLAAGEVEGLPYFTMPFVDGESLRGRIGAGLPITEVIAILRDVSRALAYAHARGVVHRDIKPDNVLLSGGAAVVTDFGIAKAISAALGGADRPERARGPADATLTSIGTSIGTPAYMAPEQVAGDPDVDHRVDLYALGCLAYEMLSGRSPFGSETPQRMLAAHLSSTATPVRQLRGDCPPSLAALVTQLLEKDPADRPTTAEAVLAQLDEATISGSSLSLGAPGMLPKALAIYAMALAAVWILAKAAIVGIGLPDWTLTGAMVVMLLGLPALLLTAYVKRVARRAATATPTLTPGGTAQVRPLSGTMTNIALKANRHVSWKRTARGGMLAMGAFVVLIAAFMITRAMGIGPAASLFAKGTLKAQDRILIASLVAAPEDTALASIVEEAVRAAMSQSNAIRLLTPVDVATTLGEMQRPLETPLDADVAREVATRTGAKAILGGRLARAGTGFAISLQLTGAAQGTLLASVQGTTDGQKDLLQVVDGMTRTLRSKLGESLKQVQNSVPLARATTSSLVALRKYTDASRANDIDGDYDKAVELLREAVTIDSTFALAWRKLNAALTNAGASQAARDSVLERAAFYADKLPPIERNMVLGAFNQAHSTLGDRGKALAAYRAVYALDSSNTAAINQLALLYADREADDSALRYARRQFELQPVANNVSKVILGLVVMGQFDRANALSDSVRRADPDAMQNGNLVQALAWQRYFQGDTDSTMALLAVQQALPSIPDHLNAARSEMNIALTGGRVQRFTELSEQMDSILGSRGVPYALDGFTTAAMNIVFLGHPAEGVATLDRIVAGPQWAAMSVVDRPWFMTAILYARAGRPEKGRALMARRLVEVPGAADAVSQRSMLNWVEGELALAEGKYPEAVTHFRASATGEDGAPSGISYLAWDGIARTFDQARQLDSARVYHERYLAVPPTRRWADFGDPLSLAATRKRLGELYEEQGERSKAITQYQAFVDQWQDADPELQPAVASVRARLRELRAQEGN